MALNPAPAMNADHGGGGGGGAKDQGSMVVVAKPVAVCTSGCPLVVADDLAEDQGGDTDTSTFECSSSFGDSSSGFEGEADGGGEPEVDSVISAHAYGGGGLPRRKKVTAEWSNFVHPILWRCQWLELRMNELSSQVSKYDKELALINKEKELQQAVSKANCFMLESMHTHQVHGDSIMKRRKRKRHEENVDGSLYIKKHQILSYYHDKQNTGAETGGVLIDDNYGSTVDGRIRGGIDIVTLLNSENYDMIFKQLTLKDTLMAIEGLQSRVHLLQGRLSKTHCEGQKLAVSEENTRARVPRNRQHTQKCSFSYIKCRYTKPQKRKNLNILLKDDDGPSLSGRPGFSDSETEARIKDANRNTGERIGECNHSLEKTITVDLLLGTDNSIPNGHVGNLWKENSDDILIDNEAANEACQQFDKANYLPSGTSSKSQSIPGPAEMKNISGPVEVKKKNSCAPADIDSTSAPAVEPVSPQSKQELKLKKRKRKRLSFFTNKQRKEVSTTPAAKEKTEGMPSAAKNKSGSTASAAAAEKTESAPSSATGLRTTTGLAGKKHRSKTGKLPDEKREFGSESAASKKQETGKPSTAASKKQETGKPSSTSSKKQETGRPSSAASNKQETGNPSSAASKQETGNPSSAAKKQETENPSSAAKKQKTENPSSATKKQDTENALPATKEIGGAPLNMKIEKAVQVAVNTRRSQRVPKPKVFAE